ncbi:flagellar hook-associated protein 2 [Bacillus sp. PS06]|nr:flagellar hook-associated protein 2 [Bacillus sp. PS06]
MRIGGLASGMDTDQMVKDLMKAERMPLNKLQQQRQYLEWQRNDFRELNAKLLEFDQLIFNGIARQASFTAKTVTSSNSSAVTVKNVNSTNDIAATIKVRELASAATMHSKESVGIDPTKKFSELFGTEAPIGEEIKVLAIGTDGKLQNEADVKAIKITGDDTLDSVLTKINSQFGVSAFYDEMTGKISITAKNTGDAALDGTDNPEIALVGDFFTNTLKLDSNNIEAASNNVGSLGKNASFEYNGLLTSRSTNTFRINGYEYSLKQTTEIPGSDPQAFSGVTFSSTTDTDTIFNTIKTFVDKYNELIASVNSKVSEGPNRSYKPLTDEEKEALSEKQIEQWEEQAKKGTLYRDQALSSSLEKMRTSLYTTVAGTSSFNALSQIGITTSSNYLDKGKLVIDETKLREAISSNPNGVYELFQKDGATSSDQGLARRLRSTLKDTMANIDAKAGKATSTNGNFAIGRNLNNINNQISSFERRLIQIEDRYWKQFTAMEKALQQSNNQYSYLMQQFGTGM